METPRYFYHPDPSIWLSVDPLSDKYPNLTPYAYCANNPVILMDPDGRDIWDIDENGIIVNRHKDKTKDVIRRVDSNGNPIEGEGNSETFKYRTIKERNHTVKVKGDDETIVPKTLKILEVQGDDNALSAFKFLIGGGGENQVEWGLVRLGKEGSGRNLLGTGNEPETSYMAGYALAWKYTIREDNHNHPKGTRIPSESDIEAAEAISDKFKNARFNLYISPKAHPIQYNKNSIYVGRDGRIHPGKTY